MSQILDLAFDSGTLHALRAAVQEHAGHAGMPEDRVVEVVLAVHELAANAVRHGHARKLTVSLARQDGHVELAVRDTGTGFDPAAPHAGSGLAHIRDRAAEIGGTVHIDSAPGRGAALIVRVPVP